MDIGKTTAILLYVRTLMNNAGAITNNIQAVAKVFGSAYEISMMIVMPNKVLFEGSKKPSDEHLKVNEVDSIKLDDVKFTYPSKENVQVLKGVTVEVGVGLRGRRRSGWKRIRGRVRKTSEMWCCFHLRK